MRFSEITMQKLHEVGAPLIAANCEETGIGAAERIDWELYHQMYDAGVCEVHGAWDSTTLVGYAVYICSTNPKDYTQQCANCDVIFIAKSHRPHAITFLNYSERLLAAHGCQVVYHQLPLNMRFGMALERRGYTAVQTVYEKEL